MGDLPEACRSGAQPSFLRLSPGQGETRFGASLPRDAGRGRVPPPRTQASPAHPSLRNPEGPEAPASPSWKSRVHLLRFRSAQSTAKGRTRASRRLQEPPPEGPGEPEGEPRKGARILHMRRRSLQAALPRVIQGAPVPFGTTVPIRRRGPAPRCRIPLGGSVGCL